MTYENDKIEYFTSDIREILKQDNKTQQHRQQNMSGENVGE